MANRTVDVLSFCDACTIRKISGLDKSHFSKYWKVESESPDYKVSFSGDTCEIVSPKGLTLWRKEKCRATSPSSTMRVWL